MQVVYSRQVGKACLAQTLARDAGRKEQVAFWVMVPPSNHLVVLTTRREACWSL